MARMSAPVTFNAFTEVYTPKRLVDNIVQGTPGLDYLRKNMESVEGTAWEPIVKLATNSGEWYGRTDLVGDPGVGIGAGTEESGGAIASLSSDIADRAKFTLKYYRIRCLLPRQDVVLQGGKALVKTLKAYIDDAVDGANSDLSTALFASTAAVLTPDTLQHVCDNVQGTEYGGLTPSADGTSWVAHVMEGESDDVTDFGKAVSPSLENIAKMIRSQRNTCGQRNGPKLVITSEDVWDCLHAQLEPGEHAMHRAAYANSDVAKWGYDAIWVLDTPVISDRDCPGAAWVSGQATRANAAGYQAFLLDFNSLKLAYSKPAAFKWDEEGWRKPDDFDGYLNFFYIWATIGTDHRRAQGRIFNMCIDVDELPVGDWALGTVDVPA